MPLGNVAKDENDTGHLAVFVEKWGSTVVDVGLASVATDEQGVVGEADDDTEAAYFVDGRFDDGAGGLVDDAEDLVKGASSGLDGSHR